MPANSPELFDRLLLKKRRERVRHLSGQVDFLLQRAAEELDQRLDMVLRDFTIALDLGDGQGVMAERLSQRSNIEKLLVSDHSAALLEGAIGFPYFICDEEALPLKDQSLDLVTSMQALHFVNDLPGALIQIRRALKPDGLFLAAIPGGDTLIELRTAFMQAEEEVLGGVSARVAPMAGVRDYGALLQRAGFALPVVDSDLVTVSYENPLKLMHELRLMGAGNVMSERLKKPMTKALLARVIEIYQEQFGADGRIPASFEIIHLSGWSPHESQQQPLQPGSGQTPLASALGACALPAKPPADSTDDES